MAESDDPDRQLLESVICRVEAAIDTLRLARLTLTEVAQRRPSPSSSAWFPATAKLKRRDMHPKKRDPLELQRRVRQEIDQLTSFISQRQLELLIGLSQGYLSRLRAGDSTPSTMLVCALALLANDPQGRLHELKGYWGELEAESENPSNRECREETLQRLDVPTAADPPVQHTEEQRNGEA